MPVKGLETHSELMILEKKLQEAKKKLRSHGPTSLLWLQYLTMIDILKSNIRGDRIGTYRKNVLPTRMNSQFSFWLGDFHLHLQTVQLMHSFCAASGHNNYTKSIQVYLQDMQSLRETNPNVYQYFLSGNFVTRRSNRFWGGLPDDLIIEQVQL